MRILEKIALFFTIIGGINWGLVGLFDFNLVTWIFGATSVFTRIIYVFIAVCALINILLLFMRIEENDHLMNYNKNHMNSNPHNPNKAAY